VYQGILGMCGVGGILLTDENNFTIFKYAVGQGNNIIEINKLGN